MGTFVFWVNDPFKPIRTAGRIREEGSVKASPTLIELHYLCL